MRRLSVRGMLLAKRLAFIVALHGPTQLLRPASVLSCDDRQFRADARPAGQDVAQPARHGGIARPRRIEDERAIATPPVAVHVAGDDRRVAKSGRDAHGGRERRASAEEAARTLHDELMARRRADRRPLDGARIGRRALIEPARLRPRVRLRVADGEEPEAEWNIRNRVDRDLPRVAAQIGHAIGHSAERRRDARLDRRHTARRRHDARRRDEHRPIPFTAPT